MNLVNEDVENSELFNSYINNNVVKKVYTGTLWAEGPAYIKHLDTLVWSDIPNNRMMKLVNGTVSEFKNPSNFCNGNTIDNNENLISCSHGGRCLYKTDDNLNTEIIIDNFEGKNSIHQMICVLNLMVQFFLQIHHMVFFQTMKDICCSRIWLLLCFCLSSRKKFYR